MMTAELGQGKPDAARWRMLPPMNCPGCTLPMDAETFNAVYGGTVEIDVCRHCNGLWFDGRESLQLTPGSTLRLFQAMYERREHAQQPLEPAKSCPRCAAALVETFDMQRGTRFSYFRCEQHGRFTTFFQFLREKNLVRAPTPKQLAELKDRVRQVSCSNCGSPIVLADSVTCTHCEAPVSILSEESISQTLQELHAQEVKRTTVDPTVAARLVMDKMAVERSFRELNGPGGLWGQSGFGSSDSPGGDLVELGARAVIGLIKGLILD
jgi:Zn-finger nucleic acid-binding protein